jgi:pimeloyl-ACP methyl ester carboxylesterase
VIRPWGLLAVAALLPCCAPAFHAGPLPGEPRDAAFIELGGARIRYSDEGFGPAVVLLHGFAASMDTWRPVRGELLRSHRVIALDLKGFGWSDRPEGDYSPAAQAAIVIALLDHLGIERASLVGHSWGSSVALSVALAVPDRVERIALYDAWVYEEQLPAFFLWAREPGLGELLFDLYYHQRGEDRMARAFYDPFAMDQDLVDSVEAMMHRPGTAAAALAAARGQRFGEIEDRYGEIDVPVLLLWGEDDLVSPVEVARRLAAELPRARLETFARCGHFPMIEARAASNRALADFLAPGQEVRP